MKRGAALFLVLVAIAAILARVAFAATLGVTSKSVAAGNATVPACDTNGFTFPQRTLSTGTTHYVTSLVVAGVAAGCAGSTLTVNLADASGSSVGSGSASIPAGFGGGNVTVTSK
jgi:hypothetical protein